MRVEADASSRGLPWSPERGRLVTRVSARWERLSLATRFLVTNLVVFLIASVVLGLWVGRQIEIGVLNRTAGVTALYVDSVISPQLQELRDTNVLQESAVATIDHLLARTDLGQHVVSLKVWRTDGTIAYSPVRSLIGQRFPIEGGLVRAVKGEVSAEMSDLTGLENDFERSHWSRLVEIYAPVRVDVGGDVIAVMELYQLPDELESQVLESQLLSWGVVALTMTVTYLLLAGIVRTGSDTIVRQAAALRARIDELQRVLAENRRLQSRVAQAARRSTTLNERLRRRIGADLHDGPAQALALALLRLEDGPGRGPLSDVDLVTVRRALNDALADVRAIAADLRMPALAPLTVAEVAERAVRDHGRHSGTRVGLDIGDVPEAAPLAIKIALLRTLQEALSNATRHGLGRDVAVRLSSDGAELRLEVRDAGPGFTPPSSAEGEHLGIQSMRERTELLGGTFSIDSAEGRGTVVRAAWPLVEVTEEA